MSEISRESSPSSPWRWPLRLLATAYVLVGLVVMLRLSPRVPYADPWRFVERYLSEPFPANVVAADNGHREVLPNLLRVVELHTCAANQSLQIGVGMVLAMLTLALLLYSLRNLAPAGRSVGALVATVGLFWLGNGRKLAHGNESVPLFLVLSSLVLGLLALTATRIEQRARGAYAAAASGIVATFTFGSGIATFPAFAIVLVLQRAPVRHWLPVLVAALAAACGLLLGEQGALPSHVAIFERADLLLRWLGAPSVWAFIPMLDPDHAARLPFAQLRAMLTPLATAMHDVCGQSLSARWPALAFGAFGSLWLAVATYRTYRDARGALERIALGLAWFAVSVGALVVLLRTGFFRVHPEQVTTQRYVPWSMLLWTGLLLHHVARARSPARALWPALTFALLLAPSSVWTARYAWKQLAAAELTAVGAAVSVLANDFDLVETPEQDLRRALPLLAAHKAAMFAWPETALLGQRLGADSYTALTITEVVVREVVNRLGAPGSAITFASADTRSTRVVLFGPDRIVRGIAIRLPCDTTWRGWLQGSCAKDQLGASTLH